MNNYKLSIKMQSIAIFANFWSKDVDASITERMCHVIDIFLGPSLGKL